MLGTRIAALRREAGMSQAQLAALLGISPSAMGMYEQGRREPSLHLLGKMAEILKVSTDYLITGKPRSDDLAVVETMLAGRIQGIDLRLEERPDRPFTREELAVLFAALLLDHT